MSEFVIVSIILLGIVIVDAAGDAFRIHQWQNVHHTMEVVGVATWIAVWASFGFRPEYIAMYITGRIWIFDPLLNLIAGYKLTYAGKSSVYGRLLSWFMDLVKNPGILVWVIRALCLIAWLVLLFTR